MAHEFTPPKNIHDAFRHIQNLLSAVMQDVDRYIENPGNFEPEYFRDVSGAAADAHMLVTWVRDQIKYGVEGEFQ